MRFISAFAISWLCLMGCATIPSNPARPLPPEAAARLLSVGAANYYGEECRNLVYTGPTVDRFATDLAKELIAEGWTLDEMGDSIDAFDFDAASEAYLRSKGLSPNANRTALCRVGEEERAAGGAVGQYLARR